MIRRRSFRHSRFQNDKPFTLVEECGEDKEVPGFCSQVVLQFLNELGKDRIISVAYRENDYVGRFTDVFYVGESE